MGNLFAPGSIHVFDVDGPIYRRDIDIDFSLHLARKGLFDKATAQKLSDNAEEYALGNLPYKVFADQAITLFAKGISGKDVNAILGEAAPFIHLTKRVFHPDAIALLRRLTNQGQRVALLSSSPLLIISSIGQEFGLKIDYVIGSEFRSKGGRFTGDAMAGDVVEFKKRGLGKIARVFRVPKNKLVFYGNAVTDMHSAKLAGVRFFQMHPSAELAAIFERQNQTHTKLKKRILRGKYSRR